MLLIQFWDHLNISNTTHHRHGLRLAADILPAAAQTERERKRELSPE